MSLFVFMILFQLVQKFSKYHEESQDERSNWNKVISGRVAQIHWTSLTIIHNVEVCRQRIDRRTFHISTMTSHRTTAPDAVYVDNCSIPGLSKVGDMNVAVIICLGTLFDGPVPRVATPVKIHYWDCMLLILGLAGVTADGRNLKLCFTLTLNLKNDDKVILWGQQK